MKKLIYLILLLSLAALMAAPGIAEENVSDTPGAPIDSEINEKVDNFVAQAESIIPYSYLLGFAIAMTLYSIMAKGSVGMQSGIVQLAFIVFVVFLILYVMAIF